MRKKIFATGEMAKELQKEAMAIWRMGSNEENFEGMENDPVVSLLMTALAYQEYTADNELSRLKNEVLEDFSRMLIPYELCHAKPASVLVRTNTEDQVNKVSLHSGMSFTLSELIHKSGFTSSLLGIECKHSLLSHAASVVLFRASQA